MPCRRCKCIVLVTCLIVIHTCCCYYCCFLFSISLPSFVQSLKEKPAADSDAVMDQIQNPLLLPRGNLRLRGSSASTGGPAASASTSNVSSSSSSGSSRPRSKAEYFPWENVGQSVLRAATETGCKGPSDLPAAGEGMSSSSGRQKAPLVPPYHEGEASSYSEPSFLSRKRAGDSSDSSSSSNTYRSDSSTNRSWIKTPPIYYGDADEKEDGGDDSTGDTQQKKQQRQQQHEARFRHLAKELCPLIDRFGRALTDMAPFLRELSESPPVEEGSTSSSTIPAESGTNSTSSSSRGSSSDPSRSQFSLEASLLSFLRERYTLMFPDILYVRVWILTNATCRPPSPPPERAYRAPITNQPRGPLTAGTMRGVAANSGSLLTDILNAAGIGGGGSSNAGLSSSQSSQGIDGHHLDIHIAILSPPTSRYAHTFSRLDDYYDLISCIGHL